MKAQAVIRFARELLDDEAEPHLWSDVELVGHLDEAQKEAARRARLCLDATTTATSRLTLEPGTSVYALDPRVIRVERARISTEILPLRMVLTRDMDARMPGWEDSVDPVAVLVPDWETQKVRFVGTPAEAATVILSVIRLPLEPIASPDDELEVAEHHARSLAFWILHRAYLKRDSETHDPAKSAEALALFEREFGPPQPAYDEAWIQRHYLDDPWAGRY